MTMKPSAMQGERVTSGLEAELQTLRRELAQARARIAQLEALVEEDVLTGLLNRRGFLRVLERGLAFVRRYGVSAALMYLDLDLFKPINDRHGHAAGDWVLGRVARLIAGNVRASDVVGRIGGDEFVVMLWNVTAEQAKEKARVLELLIENESHAHADSMFSVGVSAGIAMLGPNDTAEAVLEHADAAMYERKRERRSQLLP